MKKPIVMSKKSKRTMKQPWLMKYWYLPTSVFILLTGAFLYFLNIESVGLVIFLFGMLFGFVAILKAKSVAVDGEYLL